MNLAPSGLDAGSTLSAQRNAPPKLFRPSHSTVLRSVALPSQIPPAACSPGSNPITTLDAGATRAALIMIWVKLSSSPPASYAMMLTESMAVPMCGHNLVPSLSVMNVEFGRGDPFFR